MSEPKPRFRFHYRRKEWVASYYSASGNEIWGLSLSRKRLCRCEICSGPAVKHSNSAVCKPCSDARVAEIKKARRLFLYVRNYHFFPNLRAHPIKCMDCEKLATEWEHRDWREPLNVEPVCRGCNARRGRAMTLYEASFRGLPLGRSLADVRSEFVAKLEANGFKTFDGQRGLFCAPQTSLATPRQTDSARQVVCSPSHTAPHIHVGNA